MNDVPDSPVRHYTVSGWRLTLRWSAPFLYGFLIGLAPFAWWAERKGLLLDALIPMFMIAAVGWSLVFFFSQTGVRLVERLGDRLERAVRARRGRRAY